MAAHQTYPGTMDVAAFFLETDGGSRRSQLVLNLDLLSDLSRGPVASNSDLAVVEALSYLVHDELMAYGTGGGQQTTDRGIGIAIRTLRAVSERLGIEQQIPFRDFTTFRSYWLRNDAHGSYAARRTLLAAVFDPLWAEVDRLSDSVLAGGLAEPVSASAVTGWPSVDVEIHELRRSFRAATTAQDCRAIGNLCVGVLEALSRTVYDPALHLREGEKEPAPDKTKQRIGRFIEDAVSGSENSEVRALAIKSNDLAQAVKHRTHPDRRDAGIAADSVILLANICRRLTMEPD